MSFELPTKTDFTIYTKSGCPNCTKVKNLLKKENAVFTTIDCDDYLLFDRDDFLLFIKSLIGKDFSSFPIVFANSQFIGGFLETEQYIH